MTEVNQTVRPRLLFLGHTLPYPPARGSALRSYHTLRELAERYDVDALLFHGRGDPTQMPLEDRVRHLERLAAVELFPIPGERSPLRRGVDRLRALLAGNGGVEGRYADRLYRRRTLELVFQRDPRIVHVDSLALHGYLPQLADRRVVLVHDHPGGPVGGRDGQPSHPEGGMEGWPEPVEREWIPRLTATLVASERKRADLQERYPGARVELVRPAVDTRHFTPGPGSGHGLAYVGGTRGRGSREALEHFATEILPRLRSASGVQALEPISWIGLTREGDRERYRGRGIDVMGYVEDIRPVVRPVACFVVPRRSRGGTTRILQAWAMGKAVVSTSVGCAELEAEDGGNILIRDDPTAFARAVLDVLEDRELRRRLGEAGRRTVEDRYSWERRGEELRELYRSLESAPPLHSSDPAHSSHRSVS